MIGEKMETIIDNVLGKVLVHVSARKVMAAAALGIVGVALCSYNGITPARLGMRPSEPQRRTAEACERYRHLEELAGNIDGNPILSADEQQEMYIRMGLGEKYLQDAFNRAIEGTSIYGRSLYEICNDSRQGYYPENNALMVLIPLIERGIESYGQGSE